MNISHDGNRSVTGDLPSQMNSNADLRCLFLLAQRDWWTNTRVVGDQRRHDAHMPWLSWSFSDWNILLGETAHVPYNVIFEKKTELTPGVLAFWQHRHEVINVSKTYCKTVVIPLEGIGVTPVLFKSVGIMHHFNSLLPSIPHMSC